MGIYSFTSKLFGLFRQPQPPAAQPAETEQSKSYVHAGCVYHSSELSAAELQLMPLLLTEAIRQDELNAIAYMSGKQYMWLDELIYQVQHDKRIYISRKALSFLLDVASGNLVDPLREELALLKPTLPGWTAGSERAFIQTLDEAIFSAQLRGRKVMLASIAAVFAQYNIPAADLPQKLHRKVEISRATVLALYAKELEAYAPLAAVLREIEFEKRTTQFKLRAMY